MEDIVLAFEQVKLGRLHQVLSVSQTVVETTSRVEESLNDIKQNKPTPHSV
jgi:hypothetical protein